MDSVTRTFGRCPTVQLKRLDREAGTYKTKHKLALASWNYCGCRRPGDQGLKGCQGDSIFTLTLYFGCSSAARMLP